MGNVGLHAAFGKVSLGKASDVSLGRRAHEGVGLGLGVELISLSMLPSETPPYP